MRKRLVSILMALCMAVSLLPVQALAADDAYTVGEDTRAKVRLYSGSLIPEENCATLTLADGTVTVYIHTEERLPVVLADTSGKYVGGDLTIYQNVSKPLTIHKAAKSITAVDGKRVSELIIAGDANVTITGGRYGKVTVETGGTLQLRGGAVDSLIIKSEGHVSVMDSIVNSVTREDGAHFLGTADREVTTAQGLAAALADSEVSKVILTADVQLTGSRLNVSRYVPVDLNGHVLRSDGSNIVFWIGNGGYLELNDSDPESTHSDFSVKGGIITGGKVPAMGSGGFAGGVLFDLHRARYLGIAMFWMMLLSVGAMLGVEAGGPYVVGEVVYFLGSGVFMTFYTAVFVWIAQFLRAPDLWCSMGRALNNVTAIAIGAPALLVINLTSPIAVVVLLIPLIIGIDALLFAAGMLDLNPRPRGGETGGRAGKQAGAPPGSAGNITPGPAATSERTPADSEAAHGIANGDMPVQSTATDHAPEAAERPTPDAAPSVDGAAIDPEAHLADFAGRFSLTPRETEVLAAVTADERPLKHVAADMGISLRVLQRHLTSLYQKTGTQSRVGLTKLFWE